MKRICTMLFAAVLVVVLMGCSMSLSAAAAPAVPQSQVLASVGTGSAQPQQGDASSTDILRARLGLNGDRASAVSIVGGLGLIAVGCAGLYLLEKI